jgi:NAD-dependent deacetylase
MMSITKLQARPASIHPMDLEIIQALRAASRVVVFTGSGVSAESGIPTFRDKQSGLWENFDAADLATRYAFERDPAFVWGWYEWRRAQVLKTQPNAGHVAIAEMANRTPQFALITQNVDDLHERAGSRDVTHLHGELSRPYCGGCRRPYDLPEAIPALVGTRLPPPLCLTCGAKIRPGVVWFGEQLPQDQWHEACESAERCDFFICCGTSALVQPAASLTRMAIDAGATTLQVNPNPTDLDGSVTFTIKGPSGTILPQLVAQTWSAL